MPRFHFNVYDRVCVLDTEGTELPNWQASDLGSSLTQLGLSRFRLRILAQP